MPGSIVRLLVTAALSVAATDRPVPPRGAPVTGTMPLGNKPGNPTYLMPPGQRLLSPFGERPVFSPDGRKIAFIGKSYGDAFEYDLATGTIRNLTGHMAHQGFLRVHYLSDGSFILAGPHVPAAKREDTRLKTIELFWLDAAASRPPVPLERTIFEGVATSRASNRIAWTELRPRGTGLAAASGTTLFEAKVVVTGGGARLADVHEVVTTTDCLSEAQDFLPGERGVTMPCYHFALGSTEATTQVISANLADGRISRYPTPAGLYGEVEGLFPDGRRTLVECSGDRSAGMDLCVLDLKESGGAYTRLTHIMDYGRWKYGNPVVSPDGRRIAAQVGSADVIDIGVGQGIVLMDLPAGF